MNSLDLAQTDTVETPGWLRGAWRRRLLRTSDGLEDRTTDVLWMQTPRLFADIRVPADRPNLIGRRGVQDCAPPELVAAARTRGFAGWATFDGDICRWFRPIDFQPPTGQEDAGRLVLSQGSLWEHGLQGEYSEEYFRETDGAVRLEAWGLTPDAADPRPGILLIVDNLVVRAIGRRRPLPPGQTLAQQVVLHSDDIPALRNLFDCELSLATLDDLVIIRSTLAWREGSRLAPKDAFAADTEHDALLIEQDDHERRRWRRCGGGVDAATLAKLLN